jgi:hypothetical protein
MHVEQEKTRRPIGGDSRLGNGDCICSRCLRQYSAVHFTGPANRAQLPGLPRIAGPLGRVRAELPVAVLAFTRFAQWHFRAIHVAPG